MAHDVVNTIPQLHSLEQQQAREGAQYEGILVDCGVIVAEGDRSALGVIRARALSASRSGQAHAAEGVAEREFGSEHVQEQEVQLTYQG